MMDQSVGYMLTRFDDVYVALKDDEVFSNRSNANGIGLVMGRTIVEMDGREHLRHRNIITPALAPRALRGDFPRVVEATAHKLIDEFAGRGQADLVEEFTFTYPLQVFTQILGLDPEMAATFHRWAIDLSWVGRDPQRGLKASQLMAEHLQPVVAQRRAEPTDDLISRLVSADVDGRGLADEEVVSFLRLLVMAGAETTYHLMGSALFGLMTHPEQLEEVRQDRSQLDAALDETLRWESPVQIVTRETLQPTVLSGVEIPAGTELIVGVGSANRDESHFEDPDRFDLHRKGPEHIAFGFGKHYCAGSRLALLEAHVGITTLLDRLPKLRLDPGQDAAVVGMAFRGPNRLPVLFDA
jgi:cytochrome P450